MSRRDVYYWKCDRPAAFHGTREQPRPDPDLERLLRGALRDHFESTNVTLAPGCGQGNHLTWNAEVDGLPLFIRVENGPEGDDHLEMESLLLGKVAATGVPVPRVHGCDAGRTRVPFAWQALERIPFPDLNHWYGQGVLDTHGIAFGIGRGIAAWQRLAPPGFGSIDLGHWRAHQELRGFHARYPAHFHLRLDDHLRYLEAEGFLPGAQRETIEEAIEEHRDLLDIDQGCLVHKDLALWNILGSETRIAAFIDFDDAIIGDPMDDLSLLACFHDAAFLTRAFEGYATLRPLPDDHLQRFWLHLLRNLIVKAVIRVGSGYFDREESFFLIGPGRSGASLKQQTEQRLVTALHGLRTNAALSIL